MLLDKTDRLMEGLMSLAEIKAVRKMKPLLTAPILAKVITITKKYTTENAVISAVAVDQVFPLMMKDTEFPQFAAAYEKDKSRKVDLCNAYQNVVKDKFSTKVLEEIAVLDSRFKDVTMWELILATKYMSAVKRGKK